MSSKNGNGSKKNGNGHSFTKKVEAIIRKNEERKSRIYEYSGEAINYSGFTAIDQVQDLTRLAQGKAVYERIGNSVAATYLQMRYQVTIADGTNVVRILLFQYLSDCSTKPDLNQLLTEPDLSSDQVYGMYVRNMKDVRILYDKTLNLDETSHKQVIGKININLVKKMKGTVSFNDTSVDGKGHLFLTVISDSAFVSHPLFTCAAKISYRDS